MSTERFGGSVLINGVPIAMDDAEVDRLLRTGYLVHRRDVDGSRERDDLMDELDALGFAREVRFRGLNGKRRFRFDAAHEAKKIGLDYHGWGLGTAHMARKNQAGDHEKVSEASLCGYTYIICDAISVKNGKCVEYVMKALTAESERPADRSSPAAEHRSGRSPSRSPD